MNPTPYLLFYTHIVVFVRNPSTKYHTKSNGEDIHMCWTCVCFYMLVDVRQLSVVPIPVAFQIDPVLSFVVRVGPWLKPPAEI